MRQRFRRILLKFLGQLLLLGIGGYIGSAITAHNAAQPSLSFKVLDPEPGDLDGTAGYITNVEVRQTSTSIMNDIQLTLLVNDAKVLSPHGRIRPDPSGVFLVAPRLRSFERLVLRVYAPQELKPEHLRLRSRETAGEADVPIYRNLLFQGLMPPLLSSVVFLLLLINIFAFFLPRETLPKVLESVQMAQQVTNNLGALLTSVEAIQGKLSITAKDAREIMDGLDGATRRAASIKKRSLPRSKRRTATNSM